MNTIKKLLPFIFGINLTYAQEDQTLYSSRQVGAQETSTDTILENIEKYLQNLGSYLGYDVTKAPETSKTDSLLDVSIQKNLESTTIKMYFGFISTHSYFPYFFPNDTNNPYNTLNTLAGQVFSEESYSNDDTRAKIDYTQSSINANLLKTPVSQYVLNMLNITPSDVCYDTNTTPFNWLESCDYPYNELMIMGKTLGLFSTDGELRATQTKPSINSLAKSISNITFSSFFPGKNKNLDTNLYLLKQLDSTAFIGPLMYDTGSNSGSGSSSGETTSASSGNQQGLLTNNQLDAAQNYVRYLTGSIKPKVFVSNEDINTVITSIQNASDVPTQLNYFKPFAKYVLDFRIYASRISLAVQNIYDSLAYRMTIPSSSGSDESESASSQSSQALNEYVMASYRLYNPNTETKQSGEESSLKTTAWQEMINNASSATVQKEMAVLLAEINYQLYQMRQQQEKLILTNSVFLLNNLTEPSLSVPSAEDAAEPTAPPS